VARPKSLVLSMSVDHALKRHVCQHNGKHVIVKGDRRLKVAVGRGYEHYCIECAQKFIDNAIERLGQLAAELVVND
jgi:hypothetical protein